MNKVLGILAVAGLAGVASAQLGPKDFTWNGSIAIPDSPGAGVSAFIDVQPDGTTLDGLEVDIIISHTWQGDLRIVLTAPWGGTMVLTDRPGVPQGTFGFSNNNFGNPATGGKFIYSDLGAATYDTGSPGAPVDNPQGLWDAEGGSLNAFALGHGKEGRWLLTVSDHAGGDIGNILQFSLHFNNIPTPGSLALLGLGGLAAARRRR